MRNVKKYGVLLFVVLFMLQCFGFTNAEAIAEEPSLNTDNVKISLKSSEGIPLKDVSVRYYGNFPWTDFGVTDDSGVFTGNLEPGKYEFIITYEDMTILESLQVTDNSMHELDYTTVRAEVRLYDKDRNPAKGVKIWYRGYGPWNVMGETDIEGRVMKELLQGEYCFSAKYGNQDFSKTQNIQNNPVIIFGSKPTSSTPIPTPTVTTQPTASPTASENQIIVSNVAELMATESATKTGNVTVLIRDGIYEMQKGLSLTGSNITYKSYSGNRDAVILKGNFNAGHIFMVTNDNVTIENLTMGEVKNNAVQVHGEMDADNTVIRNVRFFDIREHFIKGSYSNSSSNYSDDCIVENCLFEFTGSEAYQYNTGGIDVHRGKNWIVRNNIFKNIQYSGYITEGAIQFSNSSENTMIEANQIINCDRGILLGLDNNSHFNGIVRNNFVHTSKDVGIYLCNAQNAKVYNNTVFSAPDYENSIEYRYRTSGSEIINNITNKAIASRNNGTAKVENNVTNALESWFADVENGDLHLTSYIDKVVSKGRDIAEVLYDFDGELREEYSCVGADEVIRPAIRTFVNDSEVFFGYFRFFEINGVTMFPVDIMCKKLGLMVTWNEDERTMIIERDTNKIEIKAGESFCTINGTKRTFDYPVVLNQGTLCVRLIFFKEILGYSIGFDTKMWAVIINQSENPNIINF